MYPVQLYRKIVSMQAFVILLWRQKDNSFPYFYMEATRLIDLLLAYGKVRGITMLFLILTKGIGRSLLFLITACSNGEYMAIGNDSFIIL